MRKLLQIYLLLCSTFLLSATGIYAQGYSIKSEKIDANTLQLQFRLHGYEKGIYTDGEKEYIKISIPGAGMLMEAGMPQLPVISTFLQIPEAATITMTYEKTAADEVLENISPYPAQRPVNRNEDPEKQPFFINEEYYSSGGAFPQQLYAEGLSGALRDVPVRELLIYPVIYHAGKKEATITKEFTITITSSEKITDVRPTSAAFKPLYKKYILNYSPEQLRSGGGAPAPRLLIITHDDLYESILPYADWKRRKGIATTIVKTSEIGPAQLFYNDVKAFLQQQYANAPFDHLLLVGDHDKVPVHYGLNMSLNDHNYTLLAGSDYLPDIVIGRFSANTPSECDIYVQKAIKYERYPVINSDDWYSSATVIASNDGVDNMNGLHMVSSFLSNGFTTADDFRQLIGTNILTNVNNSLNNGRSWLFFIGHGYSTGWSSVSPDFNNSHIDALTAHGQIPAIVTVACANADIDIPGIPSFAEKWMNAGIDKGAANVIAATEDCAFYWTDTLGKYAIFGYLDRTAETFGAALNSGKLAMYNAFPQSSGGLTQETMEQHVVIGDPLQLPWTATPAAPIVTYDPMTATGQREVVLGVHINGQPVKDALVCISSEDFTVFASGYTDASGNISLSINSTQPEKLHVVVTGYNMAPYEGELTTAYPAGIGAVNARAVRIYPNPFSENIHFDLSYLPVKPEYVEIMNISGQVVKKEMIEEKKFTVSGAGMQAGIYFYKIGFEDGQVLSGKLIAQ